MEENKEKVNCCEGGCCVGKEKCAHCPHMCCGKWKKCHLIRKIVWILLLLAAFGFGSQWGEMKAKTDRDYRFERGGMMGFGYNQIKDNNIQPTGSVTVKVAGPDAGNATVAPKQ